MHLKMLCTAKLVHCSVLVRSNRRKLGSLVSNPFSLWTKQYSVFKNHEQLAYYQSSMTRMTAFKESCSNPTHNVASMVNTARKEQVFRNTKVIKLLLKCAAFCGKQSISLHGHRDDSIASESVNTGNFIQLVQFRAENDYVLRTYLETAPRNALYTSKPSKMR